MENGNQGEDVFWLMPAKWREEDSLPGGLRRNDGFLFVVKPKMPA